MKTEYSYGVKFTRLSVKVTKFHLRMELQDQRVKINSSIKEEVKRDSPIWFPLSVKT